MSKGERPVMEVFAMECVRTSSIGIGDHFCIITVTYWGRYQEEAFTSLILTK